MSPYAFAKVYLAHHLRSESSRMHAELYEMLHEATMQRGRRIAVAAPRGHAKSTVVSLAYVLWSVLFEHEPFVLIISATAEQAEQHLRTIREEIQTNAKLITDFPEVCGRQGAPWRKNLVQLTNGVMIRCLGAGQGVRGTKHRQDRPSLIVVDDLETQDACIEPEQREKLRDWFTRTLLKAGDARTNVVVVGTIVHYDSLLANLTNEKPGGRFAGWHRRMYQAVESFSEHPELWETWEAIRTGQAEHEGKLGPDASRVFFSANAEQMLAGTSVLWPECEGYLALMEMRVDEGRASFQAEKQNEPLDPATCLFNEDRFRYWDDQFDSPKEVLDSLRRDFRVVAACDPSMGKRHSRGDYTAIVVVANELDDGAAYVLEADIARRKPDEAIDRIIAIAKAYPLDSFYIEANQFQELMADQLEKRAYAAGISLRIEKVNNVAHKRTRIESLEPMVSSGKLRFSRRHQLLLDQLRQFPLAAHDDGPDALEMAVAGAIDPGPQVWVVPVHFAH